MRLSKKLIPKGGFTSPNDRFVIILHENEMIDIKEYFAEGTEAYFYRNDFYPFVRAELKEHDPALHELLVEIRGSLQ